MPVVKANFRDLGGLQTADGRQTRTGVLFRSEFPHWLIDGGEPPTALRTAIDLRRPAEVDLEDVEWSRWNVRRIGHSLGSGTTAFAEAKSDSYLAGDTGQLACAIRSILEPGRLPAYFFCAAGKDRTGLLAIVLLSLAGVRTDQILNDFGATELGILNVVQRLKKHAYYRELFGGYTDMDDAFQPLEDSALTVMDWLNQQGGASAWAVSAGIPVTWVAEFQAQFLEPSATKELHPE